MKALTLWQPWAWCIVAPPEALGGEEPKRIENRTWKPWDSVIGKRIAIHAGKRWDAEAAEALREDGIEVPPKREMVFGAVVCTARLKGYITGAPAITDPQYSWSNGSVGWVLEDVITLREPIACKGGQGLWTLPADLLARVLDEEERVAIREADRG